MPSSPISTRSTGASAPTGRTARSRRSTAANAPPTPTAPRCGRCWRSPKRRSSRPHGYFDIRRPDGRLDPSGIVKGWAIRNAAAIVEQAGVRDFFIEAGGDIQSAGNNADGRPWKVGIRSPFNADEIIKIVYPHGRGIATSAHVRGQHIVDPHRPGRPIEDIVSLTVIASDVLDADRFATAAFAMGKAGIGFIERTPGLEGYLVDRNGRATLTSGFEACCRPC